MLLKIFTAPLLHIEQATPEALSAADRRVPLSAALERAVPNQHAAKAYLQQIGAFSPSAGGGVVAHQSTLEALSAADRRVSTVCWSGRGGILKRHRKAHLHQIGPTQTKEQRKP